MFGSFRSRGLLPLAALALATLLGGCYAYPAYPGYGYYGGGYYGGAPYYGGGASSRSVAVAGVAGTAAAGTAAAGMAAGITDRYSPACSSRRIARAQACARGTRLSIRRNSSGLCALPPTGRPRRSSACRRRR